MDAKILPEPSPKKRNRDIIIEKQEAFPVIVEDSGRSAAVDTWSGTATGPKRKCFLGYLQDDCVVITDQESMKALYGMGFFGKGTLSRSAPEVCIKRRQKEEISEEKSKSDEESSSEDTSEEEGDRDWKRRGSQKTKTEEKKQPPQDDERNEKIAKEKLQLMFEEAFFLCYGLGCLVVMKDNEPFDILRLWQVLSDLTPNQNFPVMYTAYHHFRSKGWVVRSGLKYGVDYVLYKEGPPFYHSTYAVVVKTVIEKKFKEVHNDGRHLMTWTALAALNRVVSHVAKALMFLYVLKPEMMSESKVSTPHCVSQFKLQEVLVKRWVSSEGREDEDM